MIVRFAVANAARVKQPRKAQAACDKAVSYALKNGWEPQSFERQFKKRPKLYTKKVRTLVRSSLSRLSKAR